MKSRINKDEREISISELWWYVISKWKWLVIGMVVGALLMGAFGAYKAYSANNVEVPKEITMDDLATEEQEEIKALIEDYTFYLKEEERLKNNYMMKLDYNNVDYCLATYYIDTDFSYNYTEIKENYTETLVSMYKSYVHGEDLHEKIMALNIEGLEEIDLPHIVGASNEGYIIKIGVYGDGKNDELLVNTICEAIECYYEKASEIVGEHKLVRIGVDIRPSYSDSVRNRQNVLSATLNNLYNEIEINKESLSKAQLSVYTKEISGAEGTTAEVESVNKGKVVKLSLKHIVLGAVVGIVALAVVFICIFVGSRKIQSLSELRQTYDIEILGKVLRDTTTNKSVLRKINKINSNLNETEQKQYVIETIVNKCKQNNITKLAIGSTVEIANEKIEDIIKALKHADIECKYAGNINCDVNALNTIVEVKNVIVIEQLNTTTRDDLITELEICDKLSINALGMIVFI